MKNDIQGMRQFVAEDGILCYVDPMTRVTKKNRKRHIKDGAPKKLRGMSDPIAHIIAQGSMTMDEVCE